MHKHRLSSGLNQVLPTGRILPTKTRELKKLDLAPFSEIMIPCIRDIVMSLNPCYA